MVSNLARNWPNDSPESQMESSHFDDIDHKQPNPNSNPKTTHFSIPHAISATKNVVSPPTANFHIVHAVNSHTPNHDLEHLDHERTSVENNLKGNEDSLVATHAKSSIG